MKKVSAFVRSYRKDIEWLDYCLRSLEKRGSQLCEVVVAVPENDFGIFKPRPMRGARLIAVPDHHPQGYISQQVTKMCADEYCEGDFIMHIDSDTVAVDEIQVEDFFADGQPKLLFRKWEDAGSAICWLPITKGVLLKDPPFEMMATSPTIYHRSSHELFRRHIAQLRAMDFFQFMKGLNAISEFNAMGNFCLLYTPDAYRFIRASGPGDGYPRPLKQHWSHDPINHSAMEALLK